MLTDMIEDLGIKLHVTEDHIRSTINADRATLSLPPLPAHADKPSRWRPATVHFDPDANPNALRIAENDEFLHYMPSGWTEEKYKAPTTEDYAALSASESDSLSKRRDAELTLAVAKINLYMLEQLPDPLVARIAVETHAKAAQSANLPAGVRAYKRNIAPLRQVVGLQGYDPWGFMLYMPTPIEAELREKFLEDLLEINNLNLDDRRGVGLEDLQDSLSMPLAGEGDLVEYYEDGRDMFEVCRR